jgi:crotonobetainyl-CoA:carnitine CoA-transferase CaiB-like acyl-CoA transferase
VAPLEERFRVAFLNGIGRADLVSVINSVDARDWLADEIASVIKEQTCAYWVAKLGDTSCVAPVVALNELADHGLGDRLKVVEYEGDAVAQPVGVPGFHYRQTDASWLGPVRGEHTDNVLRSVGYLEAPGVGLRRSQSAPSGS